MTREEAIKLLKQYQGYEPMFPDGEKLKHAFDLTDETVDTLLAALRGPTREMVERVFRGCADCQRKTCVSCRRFGRMPERCVDCNDQDKWSPWNFCPVCGKPLTDEAVDIELRRWKEAVGNA